jgi:predicted ATPase/class 3 adenylate cyclase
MMCADCPGWQTESSRGGWILAGQGEYRLRQLGWRGQRGLLSHHFVAGFDGEQGADMGEPQGARAGVSRGTGPGAARAETILTPDQRVRVFISSTLGELAAERAAARRAVARLHLVPVWYESGARPHPPRSMYRAYLEQSQVFVGIYWQRYGWVAPGMDVSGLEDEYRLAAGKPMLLYIKRPAPDIEPRLAAMVEGIRAAGDVSYRTFGTPRELERLLADDLAVLLSESFAGGAGTPAASPAEQGEPGDSEVPAGTVTFLLTDIEGSTRLWEAVPEAMEEALARHNQLLTGVIGGRGGVVVTSRGEGDSFFAVFGSAVAAVEAAGACQLALAAHDWPEGAVLRVRMGLHTGEARARGSDQVDHAPVNRCARVKAAGHGGQVLVTKTTRDLAAGRLGGGFGLKKLGEFRLRDLAEPELIYQLTHPGLQAEFPPLVTIAERPGNLPVPVSSFVGRERELEQTEAALDQARLVTLTGPGGVGKTRLALQAAGQVAERFGDGAWLAELAPVRDPAGVDDSVAAVFSLAAQAGQSTREALIELLRSKQLLLVLDNCEHLLEEAAALAAVLQRSCERLEILATSREGLGIEAERLVVVPPFGVPSDGADLAAVTEAEAVRLFAERAAAVKPGFQVTAENAAAVAAVVRRLDGIALAVELAAARVPVMTVAELARRLERSFAVLAAAPRGAVAHHQTLRATIDWSFQLLSGPEQALLARLAVFAGGATLDAVEAVCSGEEIDPDAVFELLAGLVARSLVVAEEHGTETRYRLLETIRQYGEERLNQAGETERWRARHAGYYAGLLPRVREHAHDPKQEVFWAVRLAADQDNLLAAWSWAIGTGNVDTAFQILAGFAPSEIWTSYPLLLAGSVALELPGAAEHPGYPLALAASAVFASMRSDGIAAEELSRRAADANARRDPPDWRVEETICAARSNTAITTGALADAGRLAERAAGLARAGGDPADASIQLTVAAGCHLLVGDAPPAVPLANEALTLARQTGAPALIATGVLAVGASVARTDPGQARACLRESRELSTALGYQSAIDHVWATAIAFLVGDQAGTLELGHHAITALQWGGDRIQMGIVLHLIAGALAATRPDAAAIIQGAAETGVIQPPMVAPLSSAVTAALGDERARQLRARGAGMDWDQALAYALTQATQALSELQSQTQA